MLYFLNIYYDSILNIDIQMTTDMDNTEIFKKNDDHKPEPEDFITTLTHLIFTPAYFNPTSRPRARPK